FESIKKITIVPEFTIDNGLLTPTMKLKKNVALDIYKNEIEAMYKCTTPQQSCEVSGIQNTVVRSQNFF
ncbi:MAG: hypothetical protein KKD92_04340, partial [Proteobacteria bacterium]|nr:hypothetical protein [Pseudomonadota bacterium]